MLISPAIALDHTHIGTAVNWAGTQLPPLLVFVCVVFVFSDILLCFASLCCDFRMCIVFCMFVLCMFVLCFVLQLLVGDSSTAGSF